MYRYRRILVGLDLNHQDAHLIRYAGLVSRMAQSETVRFVHAFQTPTLYEDVYAGAAYDALLDGGTTHLRDEMSMLVHDAFDGPAFTHIHCDVLQGAPLTEILHLTREHEIDLVVVGRDRDDGALAEKLARKAPCSVMVVPPRVRPGLRRVLVAVDFSEDAAHAADVAVAFAEAAHLDEVHFLHLYHVPTSYYKLGQTYEAFDAVIQDRVQAQFADFLLRVDLRGLRPVQHVVDRDHVYRGIVEHTVLLNADLLVVGTRGRSGGAALLMGSVAERIVRWAQVPVVAVKQKGATLTLLDALLDYR